MANCIVGQFSEDTVLKQLHELFGSILNIDVIKTVAVSCEYDGKYLNIINNQQ